MQERSNSYHNKNKHSAQLRKEKETRRQNECRINDDVFNLKAIERPKIDDFFILFLSKKMLVT